MDMLGYQSINTKHVDFGVLFTSVLVQCPVYLEYNLLEFLLLKNRCQLEGKVGEFLSSYAKTQWMVSQKYQSSTVNVKGTNPVWESGWRILPNRLGVHKPSKPPKMHSPYWDIPTADGFTSLGDCTACSTEIIVTKESFHWYISHPNRYVPWHGWMVLTF